MKKILLCAAIIVSLCGLSQTAFADLETSTWSFTVDANITGYTLGFGTDAKYYEAGSLDHNSDGYGNKLSGDNTTGYSRLQKNDEVSTLSWGEVTSTTTGRPPSTTYSPNEDKSSSISIEGLNGSYTVGTNPADEQNAALMVHVNQAIAANVPKPSVVDISLEFKFEEIGGLGELSTNVDFYMGFYETPNSGLYQDDIFYFLNPFEYFSEMKIEGTDYYLSLVSTFDKLEVGSGYYDLAAERYEEINEEWKYGMDIWGWVTPEGTTMDNAKSFSITFDISEYPPEPSEPAATPEPATMLIFGLSAMGGLPFALRRRMRK